MVPTPGLPDPAVLLRVLGDELRQVRKQRGWIRKDLQARLSGTVSLQTLATYELGTRGIGVVRLVEVCNALETSAPELLDRTLRLLSGGDQTGELQVDLQAVVAGSSAELWPLRRWAEVQLGSDPDWPGIARLSPAALGPLAQLSDMNLADLMAALRAFGAGPGQADKQRP